MKEKELRQYLKDYLFVISSFNLSLSFGPNIRLFSEYLLAYKYI